MSQTISQTTVSLSEVSQPAKPSRVLVLAVAVLALAFAMSTRAAAQTWTKLHVFDSEDACDQGGVGEPASPVYSGVLAQARDGNIYGTSQLGGACGYSQGTVYQMTPSGNVTVIHSFGGPDIGAAPVGGVTLGSDGNLYGTTKVGGTHNQGTIFMIPAAIGGTLTYLHHFAGTDGADPTAPPIQGSDGYFYGTTWQGGTAIGTVYRMAPTPPYSITSYSLPGYAFPTAPLMQATDGNFYGTTSGGGSHGWGSVFQMTSKGKLKTIYNFDRVNGALPQAALIQGSDGNFYGTTSAGGDLTTCSGNGCGVVFQLTPGGKIKVLRNLNGTTDGSDPLGGVLAATDGNLYGVTAVEATTGDGTLYQLAPQKKGGFTFSVPFTFSRLTSGRYPQLTLLQHTNGLVYGDTWEGGTITEENGGPSTGTGTFYSFFESGMTPFAGLVTTTGKVGDRVGILGQGFTGTTSVSFGGTPATYNVVSDTYLEAFVPAGTTGLVSVVTPTGTLNSNKPYRVTPVVLSFKPSSGPVGTSVTITGTGLINTTKVTFGGVKATFTVNSDTQVTAAVPTGAKSGRIGIITPGGSAMSATNFTVTP
jgi:uncharacterized repeat protein (TIGR03803 family)